MISQSESESESESESGSGSGSETVPVLTIDGPTASGKGTLARKLAGHLGFHYLDSGALYRLFALHVERQGLGAVHQLSETQLETWASDLPVVFDQEHVVLSGEDVSEAIRAERIGSLASEFASRAAVRRGLLRRQLSFRVAPGLVADGRDMGTVVFPDARLKVFLIADVEQRAQRRTKQLIEKGISVNFADLLDDLKARDERDYSRLTAPLAPAIDSRQLDGSHLSVDESFEQVLAWWNASS